LTSAAARFFPIGLSVAGGFCLDCRALTACLNFRKVVPSADARRHFKKGTLQGETITKEQGKLPIRIIYFQKCEGSFL
jgi:hypothetical protein